MIELQKVRIRTGEHLLSDLSLRVEAGQYAVLMGKTGIGKTTILETICGLRAIESGKVVVDEVDVSDWSPADRGIGYVPQDRALFPTLTVRENVEFALRLRKRPASEIKSRVEELTDLLGIASILHRGVRHLSGGEAQRVALARGLSYDPAVLLLDEPLSALDDQTREEVLEVLCRLKQQMSTTILHVTHNRSEAERLADRMLQLTEELTVVELK